MTTFSADGNYISGSVSINDPTTNVLIVREELANTRARAEEVLVKLIGDENDGGLLGDMMDGLAAAPTITINTPSVDTSLTLETSGQSVPVFDTSVLRDFPTDSYTAPTMVTLPSVDTDFDDVVEPDDLALTFAWAEASLPTELYEALKARIMDDLANGATGLNATQEAALYQRARTRQAADRLEEWNRINNAAAEMQFAYPSGVLLSGLAGFSIGANRMDADIENNIVVSQGELMQKNSQSVIAQAVALETLLRQTRNEESGRLMDRVKHATTLAVQDFAERVRKFIGVWEGRKVKVEAQAESLKGAIATNTGLIEIFSKQNQALETQVNATAAYNKGHTDVFLGRVQGFGEAERAVSGRNDAAVKLLAEKIKAANMALQAETSSAEQLVAAYTAEQSIRERITAGVAGFTSQAAASLLGAVSTSMGASYSAGESANKSYHVSVGVSESHDVPHDPAS